MIDRRAASMLGFAVTMLTFPDFTEPSRKLGSLFCGLAILSDRTNHGRMDLFLRKVIHSAAPENYRVVIRDGVEIEIGSIGRQFDGWFWGIDTVLPMRELEAEGSGKDRVDCMRKFRAAWDRFAADQASLTEFLAVKRKRLR